MNPKAIIPLVAGLCIGGLALKLGLNSLQKAQGSQVALVPIWAARDDIPRGTAIDEGMLQTMNFPSKGLPAGAIKDKAAIIGRVPRVGAPAGLPILEAMLLPAGTKAGIYVKPGFRAVAVRIDESSGVDFHLEPGSHVDVVGFYNVRGAKAETVARTLLENVEVAAVGTKISSGEQEDKSKKASGGTPQKQARAVTLFVKPEDVPRLHMAEQRGKLKLSMRSVDDESALGREVTATEDELLGPMGMKEDKSKAASAAMGGILSLFRSSSPSKAPSHAAKDKEPAPTLLEPPPPPPPAWTMNVWNGGQKQVLGWQQLDSIQPFEISREGGKSSRASKAAPAVPPTMTSVQAPSPPPPSAMPAPIVNEQHTPAADEQPEPEPEELPE